MRAFPTQSLLYLCSASLAWQCIGQTWQDFENVPGPQKMKYWNNLTQEQRDAIKRERDTKLKTIIRAYAPTSEQIAQWGREKNLEQLWRWHRQTRSLDTEGPRVRMETEKELRRIPEHAIFLGDQVEHALQAKLIDRDVFLYDLADLGTSEGIQQIARFLFDERSTSRPRPAGFVATDDADSITPVSLTAAMALIKALGPNIPVHRESLTKRPISEDVKRVQAWWLSDAAKKYREWKPEQALQSMPDEAATMTASGASVAENTMTTRAAPPPPAQSPSWAALIGALAALVGGTGFLLWLGLRKRGGG